MSGSSEPVAAPNMSRGSLDRQLRRRTSLKALKLAILRTCELLGLFRISVWIFRKRLHILCYHGFELHDECAFRPQLFISGATFERRLRYIAENGFTVLPLGDALTRLRSGSLPQRALVITIDDGFKSTLVVADPLLKKWAMPATVYVTTYYMDKQVPVFRLAVQYVFWRAGDGAANLPMVTRAVGDIVRLDPSADSRSAIWKVIEYGEALKSEEERQQLVARLSRALDVDIDRLYVEGALSIMSANDLRQLRESNIDVELHTHRHRFPVANRAAAFREIEENRDRLKTAAGVSATHFCYPSGIFDVAQWPWLDTLGVASATTCLPGLNRVDTPLYGLRRFLDSESIEFIEFRSELAGFNEILRWLKQFLRPDARQMANTIGS